MSDLIQTAFRELTAAREIAPNSDGELTADDIKRCDEHFWAAFNAVSEAVERMAESNPRRVYMSGALWAIHWIGTQGWLAHTALWKLLDNHGFEPK